MINDVLNNIKIDIEGELSLTGENFYSLNLFDSLEFMTLISAIEKEFDIEFRDDITFDELSNYETLIAEIRKEICRRS